MDEPQPEFARLLERHRKSRGCSIRRAAQKAGISDSFLGMSERGWKPVRGKPSRPMKPSRRTLIYMCRALELAPRETMQLLRAADYPEVVQSPAGGVCMSINLRGLHRSDIDQLNRMANHLRAIRHFERRPA